MTRINRKTKIKNDAVNEKEKLKRKRWGRGSQALFSAVCRGLAWFKII
jgi:hypothetical protein